MLSMLSMGHDYQSRSNMQIPELHNLGVFRQEQHWGAYMVRAAKTEQHSMLSMLSTSQSLHSKSNMQMS